jgi:hypothetical protein
MGNMTRQRPKSKLGFGVASWLGTAAVAASLCSLLAGCDDDFEDCASSRTCPGTDAGGEAGDGGGSGGGGSGGGGSGGGGGTSSDAGDAGSDVAPDGRACTINADCIDADACNGTELCNLGFCENGPPPVCENPDANHCAVSCSTEPSATGFLAVCFVTALDADTDQHGDALCAQAVPLGDDCDDSTSEIHPGLAEACNGIDDDCDGKVDIDDGLPLAGTPIPIVTSSATVTQLDATWSDSASSFGVAWADNRDSSAGEIYFARVDGDGNKINGDVPVSGMISTVSKSPAIAPGPAGFGVVWLEEETIYFRPFDASGTPVAAAKIVANKTGMSPTHPDIVHNGLQNWVVTFTANESTTSTARVVSAVRVTEAGVVAQTTTLTPTPGSYSSPSVARINDVVLGQFSSQGRVRGEYRSPLLEGQSAVWISELGEQPNYLLLAAGDVFFSAWWNQLDRAALRVAIEDPLTPTRLCDKAGVAPSADGTSDVIPFSAAFDGTDFVVIHAKSDGNDARLTVVSKACTTVRGPAALSPFVNYFAYDVARVAAGNGRVAVIWIEPNTATFPTGKIMAQTFSAQYYCN